MPPSVLDTVKDVKSYIASGLLLMAAWAFIVPSYLVNRREQQLIRGFEAYLLLQDALADKEKRLYVDLGKYGTLPDTSDASAAVNMEANSISSCDVLGTDRNAPVIPEPGRRFYTLSCRKVVVRSLEAGEKAIELSFAAKDLPNDEFVSAYLTVSANDTALPFNIFGVALTRADDDAEATATTIDASANASPMTLGERRAAFVKEYRFHVIQNRFATTWLPSTDQRDSLTNLPYALHRLLRGTTLTDMMAQEPPGWTQLQAMMIQDGVLVPDPSKAGMANPDIVKFLGKHLRDDAAYEVAGLKVAIGEVPLTISTVLFVLSALLVGPLATARRSHGVAVDDDAGWPFLQRYAKFGAAPVVASSVLLTLIGGFAGYVVLMSVAIFRVVPVQSDLALLSLVLSIAVFTVLAALTLVAQWRAGEGEHVSAVEDDTG